MTGQTGGARGHAGSSAAQISLVSGRLVDLLEQMIRICAEKKQLLMLIVCIAYVTTLLHGLIHFIFYTDICKYVLVIAG